MESGDRVEAEPTFESLRRTPLTLARYVALASGERAVLRPLLATDRELLATYFAELSPETRSRFGPHAFDRATADQLCSTIDPAKILRVVAVVPASDIERIVAYFILMFSVTSHEDARFAERGIALDGDLDCTLAPSVADTHQNSGLGSLVMSYLFWLATSLGRRSMVLLGGTQATNARAVHFYRKHGFSEVGSFEAPRGVGNLDMVAHLR